MRIARFARQGVFAAVAAGLVACGGGPAEPNAGATVHPRINAATSRGAESVTDSARLPAPVSSDSGAQKAGPTWPWY